MISQANTFPLYNYIYKPITQCLHQNELGMYPAVASPILSMITLLALSVHSSSSAQGPEKARQEIWRYTEM